ncbi:MAG TPA: SAM-dependent methyltransferase [Vicinamibacterales bacterium]|jgi:methyltransferase (TIGR00027 family)
MNSEESRIRNISDTARWVAEYRAEETERPDALFRDPFARRLAGTRGREITGAIPRQMQQRWAFITRTYLFDHFVADQVRQGVDTVVNLAAGLDTRPYRMPLPPSLKWIEVDLPDLLAYKEGVLVNDTPVCSLERVALDLSDAAARRALFQRIDAGATRTLVITEGLLIYLAPDDVGRLAEDLAGRRTFRHWVIDIASPALMQMMQKEMGDRLEQAGAPFKFAPPDGPHFFERHGWRVDDRRSMLKTAAKIKRLSPMFRLLAMLPEASKPWSRVWSGVCLLAQDPHPRT